ncbi:hypothetical protein [Azospirillum sp. TSO35-2]|uniref:hypothetical protein n=1 Tax=Azospirillum sp. TSO35-2 TaxID=716796 RepID=UPI000D6117BC|nr:hypothetical protein [Azospirillum sp. TSO35-2]PWC31251.1 hypothetical protein TSO352_31155 [Azospirillum sp. TSO35-2]
MFSRTASVIASLALGGLFLAAGWATVPTRGASPTITFQVRDPGDIAPGGEPVPVFLMRSDRSTLRAGTAHGRPDGKIGVTLFDPADPRLIQSSEAVLLNADIRVLWLLASDEERAELWRGVQAVGRGLREAIDTVLASPEFVNDYRNDLTDIGRQAIEDAWRAPETRAAYDEFLRSAEPMLHDLIGRDLKGIVLKRVEPMIWDLIGANMGAMVDVFRSKPWDLSPIDQTIESIQREVRDRGVLEKTAQRLFESWQAKAFLQTFAGAVMDAVARDTRVRDVLGRLVTDPRLSASLTPLAKPVGELGRLAPNVLFGVHPHADLNAIAAYTFRGLLTGEGGQLIILMSAQQREAMLRLDQFAPRPLLHSVPQ